MSNLPTKYAYLNSVTDPQMFAFALRYYGTHEYEGARTNNPVILGWARELGFDELYSNDEVPWCGLFATYCAVKTGQKPPKLPLKARNWVNFGKPVPLGSQRIGDMLVFTRGNGSEKGHIAFYAGENAKSFIIYGGNQSDAVSISTYPKSRLLAIRRQLEGGELPPVESGVNKQLSAAAASDNISNDTVIINTDPEINNLSKFIDAYAINMTPSELLSYSTNSAGVLKSYDQANYEKYNRKASADYLGIGARIIVPLDKMKSRSVYTINQTLLENRDYNAFISSEIKKLLYNPKYKKINIQLSEDNTGNIYKRQYSCSVWLWAKSGDADGSVLYDLTQYVKQLTINVNKNGGNFNLVLPHITYKKIKSVKNENDVTLDVNSMNFSNADNGMFVNKNSTHELIDSSNKEAYKCDFVDDNDVLKTNPSYRKRKDSFFHNFIQNNDILFIKFEQLEVERNRIRDNQFDFIKILSSELKGQVFDMIGLVDSNVINSAAATNKQVVTVSGKDLSSLVIDDGVQFFPIQYAVKDPEQIIKNSTKSRSANRLIMKQTSTDEQGRPLNVEFTTGEIPGDRSFNFFQDNSIEEWLSFIFSQLTNIDVCPDQLFSSYGDKTFVTIRGEETEDGKGFTYKKVQANGIWQICKLVIDNEVATRRLVDDSLSTDCGSLLNLIRKIAQEPLVEFTMDTYGDKYYFMVRKPPFSEKAFKSNRCINIFEQDVISDNLGFSDEYYSWYRLQPMGSFIEATDQQTMALLPAVYLPEYAEVFGYKVLDIQSNFVDFDKSLSEDTNKNVTQMLEQGRQDLDWLIETHAYLPFTRRGTITTIGDRRIKRGMNIRYFPTGEIFHVDAVSNAIQFDKTTRRNTVLQVSRGMVEKHYEKYFQIVNLLRNTNSDKYWTVNQDVFKFLLKRRNFLS